ncbi:hypothetical protein EVAR_41273_1 [Eumeta japonica]|uniref:Uncharacterized protein n=1 Tax=Eumeta variegata TaxID=151549 RepID=A0A4C1X871_EUMVA|nr:hypothetical protein EVAR_41273_1 [Eumeta japonica]
MARTRCAARRRRQLARDMGGLFCYFLERLVMRSAVQHTKLCRSELAANDYCADCIVETHPPIRLTTCTFYSQVQKGYMYFSAGMPPIKGRRPHSCPTDVEGERHDIRLLHGAEA